MKVSLPKKLLIALLILSLCSCVAYKPTYVEKIAAVGARPIENIVAIDQERIKNLHLYLSFEAPNHWEMIDYGTAVITPTVGGLITTVVFAPIEGIVSGMASSTAADRHKEFNRRIQTYSKKIQSQTEVYIENQLLNKVQPALSPSLSAFINDPSFAKSIKIPLTTMDQPSGIVILPSINAYGENADDTLMAIMHLQLQLINTKEAGFGESPLRIIGTGALAMCTAHKWNLYLEKLPLIKARMQEVLHVEDALPSDSDLEEERRKKLKELEKVMQDTKALNGFYIRTFNMYSSVLDESTWLTDNGKQFKRELELIVNRIIGMLSSELSYYFGK